MKDILWIALCSLALLYIGAFTYSQYHNTKVGKKITKVLNISPVQAKLKPQKCPKQYVAEHKTFESAHKITE